MLSLASLMIRWWRGLHYDACASLQFSLLPWGFKMERDRLWIPHYDGATRELYQLAHLQAIRYYKESMLHAGLQPKGFDLWAGPHKTRTASPPHTQASCWCAFDCCCRAMTCKTGQARFRIRETDTSCFDDDLHGGISRAQLEYATCAGKGRSCTKPWRNSVRISRHARKFVNPYS